MLDPKFRMGDVVRKRSGSQWQGSIVGTYSTALTPEGYAVESDSHSGSVQIYPAAALELAHPDGVPEAPARREKIAAACGEVFGWKDSAGVNPSGGGQK